MRTMRGRLSAALAALSLLLVFGCDAPPVTQGGKMRATPLKAVVSLSPSTTELVGSFNYSGVLKGRTAADDFPVIAKSIPIVASVKPDYEKIAQIKPDLVVYDADLYNEQDVEKIKGMGFKTFVIDAKTVEAFVEQLYLLGAEIESETSANTYADKVLAARNSALGDAIEPKPKVAVVLAGDGAEHYIAGTQGFLADVVKSAGGEPVGPASDKFVALSPEAFIANNPDMIVVAFPRVENKDDESRANALKRVNIILNDKRFANVSAVQKKRIVPIDEDVLTRRGYRVDKLIDELHKRVVSK